MSERPTPRLTGRPRRLVRAAHVIVSGGWLGLVIAMLVLGSAATGAPDLRVAAYALMDRIGGNVIPPVAVATLLTGVALSLTTPWGLVRHWWVVVKILLGLGVILSAVTLTTGWIAQAQAGTAAAAGGRLVAGAVVHLAMLGLATVISVDKPWGRTPRGRRLARRPARRPARRSAARPRGVGDRARPVSVGADRGGAAATTGT